MSSRRNDQETRIASLTLEVADQPDAYLRDRGDGYSEAVIRIGQDTMDWLVMQLAEMDKARNIDEP